MICNAAKHQVAIEMLWLQFCHVVQSLVDRLGRWHGGLTLGEKKCLVV